MELPPKVDPVFLLRIKGKNPDLFYSIIAELDNDDLTQLCSYSKAFGKFCEDPEFWNSLWRIKFKGTPPDNSKRKYLDHNMVYGLADFLYRNRGKIPRLEGWGSKSKEEILRILLNLRKFRGTPLGLNDLAIDLDNPDLLVYAILNGDLILYSKDAEKLTDLNRADMVDRLLTKLSPETIHRIIEKLSLTDIVELPRSEDQCSLNLVQERVQEEIEKTKAKLQEIGDQLYQYVNEDAMIQDQIDVAIDFQEKVEDALRAAYTKKCDAIIDYLIKVMKKAEFINRGTTAQKLGGLVAKFGDLERFIDLVEGYNVGNILFRIPIKDRTKFMEYLLQDNNYNFPRDLANELVSHSTTFSAFFPYLEKDNYDQVKEFISVYLDRMRALNPNTVQFLIMSFDPETLEKVLIDLSEEVDQESYEGKRLKSFQSALSKIRRS